MNKAIWPAMAARCKGVFSWKDEKRGWVREREGVCCTLRVSYLPIGHRCVGHPRKHKVAKDVDSAVLSGKMEGRIASLKGGKVKEEE